MKKLLFLLLLVLTVGCECPYNDVYTRKPKGIYVSYKNDYFCAQTLIGTWQCCYPMIVLGNIELKSMVFKDGRCVDITMSDVKTTGRYTETFSYSYCGNTINFSSNGKNLQFKITGYIWPELYLQDSFGYYTMRKTGL